MAVVVVSNWLCQTLAHGCEWNSFAEPFLHGLFVVIIKGTGVASTQFLVAKLQHTQPTNFSSKGDDGNLFLDWFCGESPKIIAIH